jgi:hypothetical protein
MVVYEEKAKKAEWSSILSYFKENPAALLDAIPTPRGEDESL